MNLPYKPKARRVVPNWRYYENTLAAGELDEWKVPKHERDPYSIDDYKELWQNHRSLYRAGDLLSAAITNGYEKDESVKEVAHYIVDQGDTATKTMLHSALRILGSDSKDEASSKVEINRLRECTAVNDIYAFIHTIRMRLHLMPYNPFLYVDLSRAYLLLGQTNKAEDAMKKALHFGAENRFVARSAARFYLHLNDKDRAYELIRAKGAVAVDPWLMAAEISICMLRDKTSNYLKKGQSIIDSGNCSPFGFTELASSIGTQELYAGANRHSNKLFRKAMIAPNDNSLAQIQWVNRFDPLKFDLNVQVNNDYEVRTFDAWIQGRYEEAAHEAVSWICDMPFSHKPINIGYTICSNFTHDYSLASAILDVGLRTDESNPFLLNNKAYCAARGNQIDVAKEAFAKLQTSPLLDDSLNWQVCKPATEGLILYRDGKHKEGAAKYQEAINIAQQSETEEGRFLFKKAKLNYCRERLIAGDENPAKVMEEVSEIVPEEKESELKILLNEIETELKNKKNE